MIGEKKFILLFVLLFLTLKSSNVLAFEDIDIDDTYNFDESSMSDEVAFEDYDFDFQVVGLDSNADLVCYNWDVYGGTDSYGGEDYCIYTSSLSRDECIDCWLIDVPSSNMDEKNALTDEINDQVCDGCDYDTSNRFGDTAQANIYYNCDSCGSSSVVGVGEFYSVIRPRQYFCENDENNKFIVRGKYSDRQTDDLKWVEYDRKYCSNIYNYYYGCATDRDEINDNTGTTNILDPCAIKDGTDPGNSCFSDNDCISRNCDGAMLVFDVDCDSDGSDGYEIYSEIYEDSCGGGGWLDEISLEDSTCSAEMGSSDYVCDADLAGTVATSEGVPKDSFCMLKEYASCNVDSECWNDNGGYDCMGVSGNKICTTGANGKNCYNNDDLQCDSLRCDNTCQARLTDGQSCDENNDCINGTCSGGICGGPEVIVDLAIVDIIPVQVIKGVDLVEDKYAVIRVIVKNYGNQSEGLVNVIFDGTPLSIASWDSQIKNISPNGNATFDFDFTPTTAGDNKEIIANVTVI